MSHNFALFGHPVAHSLSPRIQQAFAEQCGRSLDYALRDVAPADFDTAVKAFFRAGGQGANITVPHKRAAFELADEHGPAARQAGVANVLCPLRDGRLRAHNTDGSGLLADLAERRGLQLAGMRVLLLGAGGAARGVAGPLLAAAVASLSVANRTPARAQALASRLGEGVKACSLAALADAPPADLIIHATAAGHAGARPDVPAAALATHTICCDLSYGAAAQPFLDWARAAGAARAFDGLGMLVETAADSFALWFDERPRTEPVFKQLQAA